MSESTLGGGIAAARTAKGLSAPQLARRLGIATSTLKNWERDASEPRSSSIPMLSGVLNVPVFWLLSGNADDLDFDEGESLKETAGLDSKLQKVVKMHERTAHLLFELQIEVRRLQSEIDNATMVD